jgi:hypothetical protein
VVLLYQSIIYLFTRKKKADMRINYAPHEVEETLIFACYHKWESTKSVAEQGVKVKSKPYNFLGRFIRKHSVLS